ncbi:hypothetical protein [Labrys sp. 22185]|uniref:hypothetical protein n=1 Tax=Labrys sp. 22185 TaxID=3453888 RepID=UPI003F838E99
MTEYNVILRDADGCDIVSDLIEGLPAAKKRARYMLSDEFARYLGSSHETLWTHKAEVQTADGECVWDAFRSPGARAAQGRG